MAARAPSPVGGYPVKASPASSYDPVTGESTSYAGVFTGYIKPASVKDTNGDLGTSGQVLSSTGTGTDWINPPNQTNVTVYAAGTVYTLTASSAALDFGTTDPSLTIAVAGTYLLLSRATIKYTGATYAGAQTLNLKLRRTNNTAADLTNGGTTVELPVLTTFTGGDSIVLPAVLYTTTNTNDAIAIFGGLSATPSAGSVTAEEASIVAIKLY